HRAVRRLSVGTGRGVAGDDEELPQLGTGLGVPRGDETARAVVGAAVADHHLAVVDPRRAGDRVFLARREGLRAPHLVAVFRVDRDQPAIQCADVDLAVPRRDAARRRAAAGEPGPFGADLGIIGPQLAPGLAVVGGDDVVDAL